MVKIMQLTGKRFRSKADAHGVWRIRISTKQEDILHDSHYFVGNADGSRRKRDLEIYVNGKFVTDVLGASPMNILRFTTCDHKFGKALRDKESELYLSYKRCATCGMRDYCWQYRRREKPTIKHDVQGQCLRKGCKRKACELRYDRWAESAGGM